MRHRKIGKRYLARLTMGMVATALCLRASSARAGTVAITMDDLPIYAADFPPRAQARAITAALLAGFRHHDWRVTGFVIGGELTDGGRAARSALNAWLDAGEKLGDHGYAHLSLTRSTVSAFTADVARGDRVTRAALRARRWVPQWFRFPYLETGTTPEARDAVAHFLAARGLRIAPVSMENSDWMFAEVYDDALAHGRRDRAAMIRAAYLAHTRAAVAWYRRIATALLGREPAFVLLLHASRLNAASIDALSAILSANALRPVTLDEAVADPAYAIPDRYVGPKGVPAEQRWALATGVPFDSADMPQVPTEIAAAYARVEARDPDPSLAVPAHERPR